MRIHRAKEAGCPRPDRRQQRKRRSRVQAFIQDQKKRPCADCGGTFHPDAMEFDHVPGRGGKLFNLARGRASLRAAQAEIEKCDVVCSNCHRVRTAKRRTEAKAAQLARAREISAIALQVQRERDAAKERG